MDAAAKGMAILAVTDVVWQALIAAFVTLALAWMAQRTKKAVEKGAEESKEAAGAAAGKVEDVKQTLDESTTATTAKLSQLEHIATSTHTLVNSNMSAQLKISAVALHRIAELTKHPDDIAAADLAAKNLSEHDAKQRIVDQGKI